MRYVTNGFDLFEVVHIDVARNAGLSGGIIRRWTIRGARDDGGPTRVLAEWELLFYEAVG